jgi:signal peptidase II
MRRNLWIGLGIAALALIADQASKAAILAHFAAGGSPVVPLTPFLNFVLLGNRGVSFGLFNTGAGSGALIFSALAAAIVAVLIYSLWKTRSFLAVLGLGLIIGGAIGNLADRIRLGSVVDFIDFFIGSWHWYVFNVGDAAICVGVGFLLLDRLLQRPETPR